MNPLEKLRASLADRYRIEREIGAGGMATVYLAKDLRHDRDVALKLLKPELGAVLGAERFLSEIRVTAKLQHPNLLPLFDSGENDGQLWYVMPFVEGETLRAKMDRERQFPLKEAVRIAVLVAGALDYAHRHRVVHRDLKPENILLQDGQPLIADFGIALAVANTAGNRITQTGLSLGTPQYMSPEQAMGERMIDARSDIYSLGAVLYEMLVGEPPFTGPTTQSIIAKLVTESPRSARESRPSVSTGLNAVVMKALEKIPADRFQTAKEFAEMLEDQNLNSGAAPAAAGRSPNALSKKIMAAAIFVIAIATSVVAVKKLTNHEPAAVADAAKSVAVLPFVNVGGDPRQEYFSDGITDEISDALGRIPRLRLASRTSSFAYKGQNAIDARAIGKQLNVSSLLEGQVLREGGQIRVSAQLTDASNGLVLWRNKYERDMKDVFAVQEEIARSIASALSVTLADTTRIVSGTKNLEAHDLTLRGRFEQEKFTQPSLRRAIELYDSASRLDPTYIDPLLGLSRAWYNLADDWIAPKDAIPHAYAAVSKVLKIDPQNTEARFDVAAMFPVTDDPATWRERARRGGQIGDTTVNAVMTAFFIGPYDLKRGLESVRREYAQSGEPLSAGLYALLLINSGRYTEALKFADEGVKKDSVLPPLRMSRAQALLMLNRPAEALVDAKRAAETQPDVGRARMAEAYVALGQRDRAAALVNEMVADSRKRYVDKSYIAEGYTALGDKDQAFAWLERAYQDRSSYVLFLAQNPAFIPLRSDPRFAALKNRMALP
jgi:TolB-like protein